MPGHSTHSTRPFFCGRVLVSLFTLSLLVMVLVCHHHGTAPAWPTMSTRRHTVLALVSHPGTASSCHVIVTVTAVHGGRSGYGGGWCHHHSWL